MLIGEQRFVTVPTNISPPLRVNIPFGAFLAGTSVLLGQFIAHLLIYSAPGRPYPVNPLRFFAEPGGVAFLIFVTTAIWFGVIARDRRRRNLPLNPSGGAVFATSLLGAPVLTLGPSLAMAAQEPSYFGFGLFAYGIASTMPTLVVALVVTTIGFLIFRAWARKQATHVSDGEPR